MDQFVAESAITTKIKSKKSNILDKDDWAKIINFKNTAQIYSFMKGTQSFSDIFGDLDTLNIHRDDLETVLERFKVKDIESIIHYVSGPYKSFLVALLIEFEIEDLMLIIRKISNYEKLDDVTKHFIHSTKFSKLPYDKLVRSSGIQDLTEKLRHTPYYNKLKTLTNEDASKREFHIEMKLQRYFYSNLTKKLKTLDVADEKKLGELIGIKIDFLNVQWIYRAIKYYQISSEEILNYCLLSGHKISYPRLKKLCYAKSLDEFKSLSTKFLNADIFSSDERLIRVKTDTYLYAHLTKKCKQTGIEGALAYFWINEIIIKDFVAVTESIKYNLPLETMKKYIVHVV